MQLSSTISIFISFRTLYLLIDYNSVTYNKYKFIFEINKMPPKGKKTKKEIEEEKSTYKHT